MKEIVTMFVLILMAHHICGQADIDGQLTLYDQDESSVAHSYFVHDNSEGLTMQSSFTPSKISYVAGKHTFGVGTPRFEVGGSIVNAGTFWGNVRINDGDLLLSKALNVGETNISTDGTIKYSSGKFQFRENSVWKELGTDTGGSTTHWSLNPVSETLVSLYPVFINDDAQIDGEVQLFDKNGSSNAKASFVYDNSEGLTIQSTFTPSHIHYRALNHTFGLNSLLQIGNSSIRINGMFSNGLSGEKIVMEPNKSLNGVKGAAITLKDEDGNDGIMLHSNYLGDARIITDELEIRGGSDLSEKFDISISSISPVAGMVVSIDEHIPGKLKISSVSYDRKVAGIISGANGVETGLFMGQDGSIADGTYPIALSGRVYVYANEEGGEITPGDLLTSSSAPGIAQRVSNYSEAHGSIIGKAMTGIDENGFVLVLVNLQ